MSLKSILLKGLVVSLFMVSIIVFGTLANAKNQPAAGFGELYYDGTIVRTVVPPATMSKPGRDDFYVVMNGVEGQLGIAAVAPGDKDYHGGKWAFHSVMWTTDPYLLTSEEDVLNAQTAGDVVVMRISQNDFKCPIQP